MRSRRKVGGSLRVQGGWSLEVERTTGAKGLGQERACYICRTKRRLLGPKDKGNEVRRAQGASPHGKEWGHPVS